MLKIILKASLSDQRLSAIVEKVRDYASVYVLARQRQKGCDGMGELAMIKEEFKEAVDALINYCEGKDYLASDFQYDLDTIACFLTAKQ